MLYTHNSNNKMPFKSESVNSNFNTDDFPTNLEDIDWRLIEMEDAASPVLPSQQPPVTRELTVPVIEVTEVPLEDTQCQSPTTTNSDKDDESEDDDDNNNNNSRLTLPPRKSRQRSGGSTTSSSSSLDSESDREWRPEDEEVQQERP